MTKEERQYCVTWQELLAVVNFVKQYHHYLYGERFLIRTDYGALKYLFSFKDPQGQMARWLQVLDTYDFEIEHRAGRRHGNADTMSRGPCRQCGDEKMSCESGHKVQHLQTARRGEDGKEELKMSPKRHKRLKRKHSRPKRLEVEKRTGTREDVDVPGNQGSDVRHDDDSRESEWEKEKPTKNMREAVKITRNLCKGRQ